MSCYLEGTTFGIAMVTAVVGVAAVSAAGASITAVASAATGGVAAPAVAAATALGAITAAVAGIAGVILSGWALHNCMEAANNPSAAQLAERLNAMQREMDRLKEREDQLERALH